MRAAPDLGIPEEKPAIESIGGRWERKVSPQRTHALLQGRMWAVLSRWAEDRGEVGTEWRFYLLPQGRPPSSLVPDVAYVSFERMPRDLGELREKPTIAPDIAVEILSPADRRAILEEKIALYFACGASLVIVVDPATRSVLAHDNAGLSRFAAGEVVSVPAYPDLAFAVDELFAGV